jgi:protein-L-isoaspartate(D-aspartate) O-methyltransferase
MNVFSRPTPEARGTGMTSQRARDRLVDRLKSEGIADRRVLDVIGRLPRHLFVEEALASRAYEDTALPIGLSQTISQPWVVARMTEALIQDKLPAKVLEIGTGSGYQAAVLSRLAREVVTVERYRTLADTARTRLATLGYDNATVVAGDGFKGHSERAPYDRIIVTAAAEEIPEPLVAQLDECGVMLLPLGPHGGAQRIVKLTKSSDGVAREDLIWVRFVPLLQGQAREL